jgi:hypothetical protein
LALSGVCALRHHGVDKRVHLVTAGIESVVLGRSQNNPRFFILSPADGKNEGNCNALDNFRVADKPLGTSQGSLFRTR